MVLKPLVAEHVLDGDMELGRLVGEVDDFTIAYLRGAELRGAQLSGIDLFGANLVGADLGGADLGAGNLSSADLRGADLSRSNLVDADLSDADLSGADLSGANLLGADLWGAHYDGYTAWPQGCQPEARGAVKRIVSQSPLITEGLLRDRSGCGPLRCIRNASCICVGYLCAAIGDILILVPDCVPDAMIWHN